MKRAFSLSMMILLLAAPRANAGVEDAYQSAREGYWKLKKDEGRRAFRHHWQLVVRRLEDVASRYPKSDRAPEAVFLCGEGLNELSRVSRRGDDLDEAVKAYQRLLDGWPNHRLADDGALALARLLAERRGQAQAAKKVLERALPTANDRKKALAALSDSLATVTKADEPRHEEKRSTEPKKLEAARTVEPVAGRGAKGARKDGTSRPHSPPERPPAEKRQALRPAEARATPEEARTPEPTAADAGKSESLAYPRPSEGAQDGSLLADAIHRAVQPLGRIELRLPSDELPMKARRSPSPRPAEEAVILRPEAELTRDDSDADSAIVSLQEQLRDVRVGALPPASPAVRAQLREMTKAEEVSEVTLAQQLGLKVRRVVIDAGHGGRDTGAIGPDGTREKDVALAIASKLGRRLEAMGLEIVMTRDDDRFVTLEERTRIANQKKGDLFISVHCNAAASKALRGIETYTLNTSSNRYSIRLAARENATSERGVGDLRYILADLATRANTSESTRLAQQVQRSLVTSLSAGYSGVRDLGTKEALFFVLLGAKMPAILVETSFISHPEEEQRLAKPEYQGRVADSIARAVGAFLEDRTQVSQVD